MPHAERISFGPAIAHVQGRDHQSVKRTVPCKFGDRFPLVSVSVSNLKGSLVSISGPVWVPLDLGLDLGLGLGL
jgi:hypothetical protein